MGAQAPMQADCGVQGLCEDIVKGDAQVLPVLPAKCFRLRPTGRSLQYGSTYYIALIQPVIAPGISDNIKASIKYIEF